MTKHTAIRLYTSALSVAFLFVASSAHAQFRPRAVSDPATGERFHIEGAAGFWFPTADMKIASTSLGIIGTAIDFKQDLGLTDQRFPELHLTLRPARQHKFRFQLIPIKYEQSATLRRTIVFNGQAYAIGLPLNSMLDWKAYRFGYEFDFITRDRGFGGFVLDFKYTDVTATLTSPIRSDFTQARAPIPAIGGIFRVYPVPNIAITGEITGFKLPEKLVKDTTGHYLDVDFYATLNFNNNLGVQGGFRSFDVGYTIKSTGSAECPTLPVAENAGCFTLKGVYFGIVARY
jgi:hypothetical protein